MQIRHEDMSALQAVATAEPAQAEPAPAPAMISQNGQHEIHNGPLPSGVLADNAPEPAPAQGHGHFSILGRLRGEKPAQGTGSHSSVTKEDIRRLQATLFELLECCTATTSARSSQLRTSVTKEDIRRLQATLFELLECCTATTSAR